MQILQAFARKMKLSFHTAVNGKEAADRFEASPHRYDLIWMGKPLYLLASFAHLPTPHHRGQADVLPDISMPVMNGMEATRTIRSLERAYSRASPAYIVALTGLNSSEDRLEARRSGMDDFFTKPISLKILQATVDSWRRRTGCREGEAGREKHASPP